ncbi:hypothetical protein [Delftia tsuruhatensis]|uniref:hypothetical protein n=1 Tax=Delftia tsuruhatensis TaxID=180282 RepID=UPI0030D130C9
MTGAFIAELPSIEKTSFSKGTRLLHRANFEKRALVQSAREGSSSMGGEAALAEAGGAPAGDSILGSGHEFVSKRMAKTMHSMH